MSYYESQFEADLERAQALSLESLALEQFKQHGKFEEESPLSENDCDAPPRPTRNRSNSSGFPPAIPPPPRRPARRIRNSPHSEGTRSSTSSPTPCEKDTIDLICFNSPSSVERSHNDFKEQIDRIHRLCQKHETLLVPRSNQFISNAPTYSAQNIIPYPSNNFINPLIKFPSNSYPNQPNMYRPQIEYRPASNYNYYAESQYKNIYPNLSSLGMNNFQSEIKQVPNNNLQESQSSTIQVLSPNPSSFSHISSTPLRDQNNSISCGNISRECGEDDLTEYTMRNSLSSQPIPSNDLLDRFNECNISSTSSTKDFVMNKSRSVDINMINSSASQSLQGIKQSDNKFIDTLQSNISNNDNKLDKTKWAFEKSDNLIDLAVSIKSIENSQADVLETFDPLISDQSSSYYMYKSECSSSIYEEFDPLDFLYAEAKQSKESPIYATVNRRTARESLFSPLPSPPPKLIPPQIPTVKKNNAFNKKLYETINVVSIRKYNPELKAFLQMIKEVRASYPYTDSMTNPGYVVAAKSEMIYPLGTSVKLLVHYKEYQPIAFTCDVETTVEHVIMHVMCELEGEIKDDVSHYALRVWGMSEYLITGSTLSRYNYIRQCIRLEKDILLSLQSISNKLARTEKDDVRDSNITLDKIIPNQNSLLPISHSDLSILLETLERELSKVTTAVMEGTNIRIGSTAQAVKAICALLGGVETMYITTALATLVHACNQATTDKQIMKPEIVSDNGDYSNVSLRHATLKDTIGLHCQRLREAVRGFIAIYCRVNRVDFELDENPYSSPTSEVSTPLTSLNESPLVNVEGIHRPPAFWNHDEYIIHVDIYYGTTCLKGSQSTLPSPLNTQGFYPRILFEAWFNLTEICISKLPKESRFVFTLSGCTLSKPDNQNTTNTDKEKSEISQKDLPENQEENEKESYLVHVEQEELGWASIQLFDFEDHLISGSFLLPIWPNCSNKRLGPAPNITDSPLQAHPLLLIEIPSYTIGHVHWKKYELTDNRNMNTSRHSFESLDAHTQQQLLHLVEQGPHQKMPSDCREVLWEKRHYLIDIPEALPLVLLASVNWDAFSKWQLLQILDQWKDLSPYDALYLLLPCFPDYDVRAKAVSWLSKASSDLLITLMPQLCLSLRYEHHLESPLARFLLSRSLESLRFAHRFYWQLVHDLPGSSPPNSDEYLSGYNDNDFYGGVEADESIISTYRWVEQNQIMLRALLAIVGENLTERLLKQQLLVKGLSDVANSIKKSKDNVRDRNLKSGLRALMPLVSSKNVCLPLSVSQELYNIDIKTCSYFSSYTLPLKISFIGDDETIVPAIFKIGDDLRQDALVLQVIRVFDQLWLKEGLDLSMVTFEAIPTQYRKGIIEMVCDAETLRCIQVEWGLTGSFKDKPIAEWLAKHNPSELEYERAVTNFTASCAGYSVATYLLGICDRHNDNIMLKTSGHLFHIDFGKFLGDAQMFGNFKRDRTPFVLTPDMAYVINGGERPSQKFHHFVDLCCTAFNIVRKHQNLILNLFSLMASSGITGVSASAVSYVRAALLPGQSSAEAAATFARLIHSALKSRFTPINFFLHNLAQFRAGDPGTSSNETLSFMPKTYTMEQDGRLTRVEVISYEKRYEPEKYYVYSLRTYRQDQATPFIVYRSYRHFTELYQKICLQHPLTKIHRLPVGLHMGRSNTKQVAERRFGDIKEFICTLFLLADEISHSSLVYTFFHPLLKDQQDVEPQRTKNKSIFINENIQDGVGALKLSIQYSAGVLSILVLHARSLPLISQGIPPSPYVKVYLIPDPSKETKRKTRVLKRNSHPSFMEVLEYRLPLEVIRGRDLQATVWHYDPLQENQFLGGIVIELHSLPLTTETVEWYPLKYIPKNAH